MAAIKAVFIQNAKIGLKVAWQDTKKHCNITAFYRNNIDLRCGLVLIGQN
jgi:hypothetical protein